MICTGADLNAFMADKDVWKDGYWYDDVYCEVNCKVDDLNYAFEGEDVIPPEAVVIIEGGEFYVGPDVDSTFYDFEERLTNWMKARGVSVLVLEVDNDMKDHILHYFAHRFPYTIKVIKK